MVKPGYKETEVGIIPGHWKVTTLKSIFTKIEAGVSVNSDDSLSSEYYVLKTSAVHNGLVDLSETKPVVTKDYGRLKCPIKKDCLLFSRMNTPNLVGECGYNSYDSETIFLPDRLWQIPNLKPELYDFRWLNYLLNTTTFRDAIRATATGTSNSMKNISKERLMDIAIPVPPVEEQKEIADYISDMDELTVSLEKLIAKKKAIKQGAMQELLTGRKRLPGFSGGWKNIQIGQLSEVYAGGTPSTSNPEYWGGDIPWMNSGELNLKIVRSVKGRITAKGMDNSSTHMIPARCVLIGLAGQGRTRGTAAFNEIPLCTNQSIAAIYPNDSQYCSLFLYYYMDTQYNNLRELSSGDGGRGGLTKQLISKYKVYIPDTVQEQRAIASVLSDMDAEIERLEQKLAKCRQTKQGMMQQLLTGKIRLV